MPAAKFGVLTMALGGLLVIGQMFLWYSQQNALVAGTDATGLVVSFFVQEGFYVALVAVGLLVALESLALGAGDDYRSVRNVLGRALANGFDRRVGVVAGVLYAAFYCLVSGIVVYQPGVDFAESYGATAPGLAPAVCCGSVGTVPSMTLYLAPQFHLGAQLIPLDLLLLVLIPMLVGVNATVASFALRNRPRVNGGTWLGGVGAVVALFSSCPTCAGYFLAGALGGMGATSVAVALAPYQALFVAVSLPVLAASPILVASTVRRAFVGGCAVEGRTNQVKDHSAGQAG